MTGRNMGNNKHKIQKQQPNNKVKYWVAQNVSYNPIYSKYNNDWGHIKYLINNFSLLSAPCTVITSHRKEFSPPISSLPGEDV